MMDDPRDRNCLSPVLSEVRYMTDDPRDRNCLPPVFSEVRYMTMILETGTVYTQFSVRFVT